MGMSTIRGYFCGHFGQILYKIHNFPLYSIRYCLKVLRLQIYMPGLSYNMGYFEAGHRNKNNSQMIYHKNLGLQLLWYNNVKNRNQTHYPINRLHNCIQLCITNFSIGLPYRKPKFFSSPTKCSFGHSKHSGYFGITVSKLCQGLNLSLANQERRTSRSPSMN